MPDDKSQSYPQSYVLVQILTYLIRNYGLYSLIWFIWLYSNGFIVFLEYPLWFIWLISNGLYALFPMVLWFNSNGLNGLIVHGLYVNGIMVNSSGTYMIHCVNDKVGFIK